MESRSYFGRLLAAALAVLAVAAVFVFVKANTRAQTLLVQEFEGREARSLGVAAWILAEKAPYSGLDQLRSLVDELGKRLGVRVTYISGGKVLADSQVAAEHLAELTDHSDRPEIVQALDGHTMGKSTRHSETLGKDMLYMAQSARGLAGLPDGVLRIASPYSDVARELDASRERVLALVAVMALCAAGLAVFVLVRARRVLARFSRAVESIAGGETPDKIRVYPGSEFKSLADSINSLSKKLRKNRRSLHDTLSQYEAVLDKMTDPVAILDENGVILAHNPALEALVGEEIDGHHALETGLGVQVHEALKQGLADPAPAPRRFAATLATDKDMDVDLVAFHTARGKRRFIVVAHDVTSLKQAERLLRAFVINASHQLRTPLTSIRGYAATLLDNPPADPAQARSMLQTVLKRSEEMSGVITELLQTASPQAVEEKPDAQTR
ncbi:hypothetical protein JCM15519_14360 [Fundidesulfovibrio butyratiphilus]